MPPPLLHGEKAFRIRLVRHELKIVDPAAFTIQTSHCYQLEAAAIARFFERRYVWTGSGTEKDPMLESGKDDLGHSHHKLHGPVIRRGRDRIFLIDLGRDLNPGDVEEVRYGHTFVDTGRTFRPFLGARLKQPTQRVELKVVLPEALAHEVRYECRRVDEDVRLESRALSPREEVGTGSARALVFAYEKDAPEIGFNHRIAWL